MCFPGDIRTPREVASTTAPPYPEQQGQQTRRPRSSRVYMEIAKKLEGGGAPDACLAWNDYYTGRGLVVPAKPPVGAAFTTGGTPARTLKTDPEATRIRLGPFSHALRPLRVSEKTLCRRLDCRRVQDKEASGSNPLPLATRGGDQAALRQGSKPRRKVPPAGRTSTTRQSKQRKMRLL